MSTPLEADWINRQPSELDGMRPNGFRFLIQNLPKVSYFCQSANIPSLSLGVATHASPLVDFPLPGEKLSYGDLVIRFMIQEDLANYIELYNWMVGLGFPTNHKEYRDLARRNSFKVANPDNTDAWQYSDASLFIIGSSNNPVMKVNFYECFPVNLEGLDFDISEGRSEYFTGTAVFKYRHFDFEQLASHT